MADIRNEVLGGHTDIVAEASAAESIDGDERRVRSRPPTRYRDRYSWTAAAARQIRRSGHLSSISSGPRRSAQLRDDVLGVFGDLVVTGKPSGNDLKSVLRW